MRIDKLWGYELILTNTELYCGKIICIYKNKKGSYHYHRNKDETFYIQSGKIALKYGWDDNFDESEYIELLEGDTFRIPPKMRHQIIGLEDSEIIEISTFDEDSDSVRVISSEHFLEV